MGPKDCAVTGTGLKGKGIDTNASTLVSAAKRAILVSEYMFLLIACAIPQLTLTLTLTLDGVPRARRN